MKYKKLRTKPSRTRSYTTCNIDPELYRELVRRSGSARKTKAYMERMIRIGLEVDNK